MSEISPKTSETEKKRQTGSIRKLKEGYGFIAGDDGENYFFHWSAMELTSKDFRDLSVRERVSYHIISGPAGPRAIMVRVIAEA